MTWRDRLTLYTAAYSLLLFAWVTSVKRERRRARQGRKFPLDIRMLAR